MNDEYSKNGTLTGPLIFTVPAYGFVMALYLDWLGQSHRAALSAKTFVETQERWHRPLGASIEHSCSQQHGDPAADSDG